MTDMTGYKAKRYKQDNQHFFAASISTWVKTTDERDLRQLIELMDKEGMGFNLFLVPVHHTVNYDINFFQPQVKGTQWLTYFKPKGERK